MGAREEERLRRLLSENANPRGAEPGRTCSGSVAATRAAVSISGDICWARPHSSSQRVRTARAVAKISTPAFLFVPGLSQLCWSVRGETEAGPLRVPEQSGGHDRSSALHP